MPKAKKGHVQTQAATRVHPQAGPSKREADEDIKSGSSMPRVSEEESQMSTKAMISLLRTPALIKERFYHVELRNHMLVEYTQDPTNPSRKLLCQILQVNDREPVTCSLRHCTGSSGTVFENVAQVTEVELLEKGQLVDKAVTVINKYATSTSTALRCLLCLMKFGLRPFSHLHARGSRAGTVSVVSHRVNTLPGMFHWLQWQKFKFS